MDPGFVLGKVPVRNLGEILGILEVNPVLLYHLPSVY
jgi:hypothetical protein